jgi:hypothetical protein
VPVVCLEHVNDEDLMTRNVTGTVLLTLVSQHAALAIGSRNTDDEARKSARQGASVETIRSAVQV